MILSTKELMGTLVQGYNNQSYQQGIMTASVSIILQFLQYIYAYCNITVNCPWCNMHVVVWRTRSLIIVRMLLTHTC